MKLNDELVSLELSVDQSNVINSSVVEEEK